MGKEKVMILGAGKFQIPLIERVGALGFETVVVSPAGTYPGLGLADRAYNLDVRDKDAILNIARRERISGVLTDQTDLPVPTVAYVAEQLGLPGIPYEAAACITDKLCSRRRARELGLSIPAFFPVRTLSEAHSAADELGYPLVVKPTDSQGARGVRKIDSKGELEAKLRFALSYSTKGVALLEALCTGRKHGHVGMIDRSGFTSLVSWDEDQFQLTDVFVLRRCLTSTAIDGDLQQRTVDITRRFLASFDLPFCIAWAEFMVDEAHGHVCLIEATVRGPGGFVTSHVLPLARGIDVVTQLVEFAVGSRETFGVDERLLTNRAAGNVYFYLPKGIVRRIAGVEKVGAIPGVHVVSLDDLVVGRAVQPPGDLSGRCGPIVYSADDRAECDRIVTEIQRILKVEVETATGIAGIRWV